MGDRGLIENIYNREYLEKLRLVRESREEYISVIEDKKKFILKGEFKEKEKLEHVLSEYENVSETLKELKSGRKAIEEIIRDNSRLVSYLQECKKLAMTTIFFRGFDYIKEKHSLLEGSKELSNKIKGKLRNLKINNKSIAIEFDHTIFVTEDDKYEEFYRHDIKTSLRVYSSVKTALPNAEVLYENLKKLLSNVESSILALEGDIKSLSISIEDIVINAEINDVMMISDSMEIITFHRENKEYNTQMAQLLVDGFKENWPEAWKDLDEGLEEVESFDDDEKICLIAVNNNEVLGWIGGLKEYDGNVWELHPLVVKEKHRNKGIGGTLVKALEEEVKLRGGLTIQLGTDDENNMTSLSGVDLFDGLLEHIKNIKNFKNHPYSFYEKLGYKIIGVMPNANGIGKPDIYMGKRVY